MPPSRQSPARGRGQAVARRDLKVAISDPPGVALNERLTITLDGEPMTAAEVIIPGEGRSHVLTVRPGLLSVDYQATIDGRSAGRRRRPPTT